MTQQQPKNPGDHGQNEGEYKYCSYDEYRNNPPKEFLDHPSQKIIEQINALPEDEIIFYFHVSPRKNVKDPKGTPVAGVLNVKGGGMELAAAFRHLCQTNEFVNRIFRFALLDTYKEDMIKTLIRNALTGMKND